MKTKRICILLMISILCLAMIGCTGEKPAPVQPADNPAEVTEPEQDMPDEDSADSSTEASDAEEDESYITYEVLGEGEIDDPDAGYTYLYHYSCAYPREDLPGAAAFMEEMDTYIMPTIMSQLGSIENGMAPIYSTIYCEPFVYGTLYSFVYTMTRWIDNQDEYAVIYFDSATGACPDANEVLASVGWDRFADFLPACVDAGQSGIRESAGYAEFLSEEEIEDLLARTREYVGLYDIDPFIGPDGTIYAAVPVASPVGADFYYQVWPLNLPPAEALG